MNNLGTCITCGKSWEYNVSGNKFVIIPRGVNFDAYTLIRGIRHNRDTDCCIVKIFARLSNNFNSLDSKPSYAFCNNKKNKRLLIVHEL